MFADDTEIDYSAKTARKLDESINSDFEKINQYLINRRLSLNTTKSQTCALGPAAECEAGHNHTGFALTQYLEQIHIRHFLLFLFAKLSNRKLL